MRTFKLVRTEDYSGISGVGVIAEGVEWTNGRASLNWLTQYRTTSLYDSIEDLIAIHSHGERTTVVFDEDLAHGYGAGI